MDITNQMTNFCLNFVLFRLDINPIELAGKIHLFTIQILKQQSLNFYV